MSARILIPLTILLAPALAPAQPAPQPAHQPAPQPAHQPPIELELRRLCDTVARGIRRLPGDTRYHRIAVVPFTGNDDDPAARDARRLVTDYLAVACLTRLHDLAVVDPGDTFQGLEGAEDPAIAARAAAHRIDIIVSGRLTRGPDAYTTSARVIAAPTGEHYAALLHPLPITPTDHYATAIFAPRTAAGAALRSAAWPGWGQIYNGELTEGILFISAQTALLGTAAGFFFASGAAWDAYHQDAPERVSDKRRAQDYEDRAAIALGLAGLVWAGAIIDAWIDGYRYDPDTAFDGRLRLTPTGGAWTMPW